MQLKQLESNDKVRLGRVQAGGLHCSFQSQEIQAKAAEGNRS